MTALCSNNFPVGVSARHWQPKNGITNQHQRRIFTKAYIMAIKVLLAVLCLMCMISTVAGEENKAPQDGLKGPMSNQPPAIDKDAVEPRGPVDKEEMIKKDPYGKLVQEKQLVDLGFIHACVASFSVILVSEIGDKTFFITAIMSMRHSRIIVFAGAMFALIFMTILSAFMGWATTIIPRWVTYYASSALFAVFGIKMIREGLKMSNDTAQEEYEEVSAELRSKEEEHNKGIPDPEIGIIYTAPKRFFGMFFSRTFLQAFTMNVLAEWGDRSQIATIILAAREEVLGVILGGIAGHTICTSLAVLGGRFISARISARTVTLVGGVVFLIFAASAFVIEPDN